MATHQLNNNADFYKRKCQDSPLVKRLPYNCPKYKLMTRVIFLRY